MATLRELQSRLDEIIQRQDELYSKEAIRECIYRINRGMDRIDRELMLSGFHSDAKIRWGTAEHIDLDLSVLRWVRAAHHLQ
jgi:hypothetical protein